MIAIKCPQCGAQTTNRKASWGPDKPCCPVCGWNLERAKEDERQELRRAPVVLLCCALVLGVVGYRFATATNGTSLVLFIVVAIAVGMALASRIKLKAMGASQSSTAFSDTSRPASPIESLTAKESSIRLVYESVLTLSKPRRTSLKASTVVKLVVFLCIIYLAWQFFGLAQHATFSKPKTIGTIAYLVFVVVLAASWATKGVAMVRSVFRDRNLLANGEVAIAIVVRQQTDTGGRYKTSAIEYQFEDQSDRRYMGKCDDNSLELYEDMQTLVFYNRDNPAENVALVGATSELVDF
jgi:hypothetical protein